MTTPTVNSISIITSSVMAALFMALRRFLFCDGTFVCYWTAVCEAATTGAAVGGVTEATAGATGVFATGVAAGVVVAACCCGITSFWPYWTFLGSVMLFALRRSSVLIPYFLAMVAGDSLKSTM